MRLEYGPSQPSSRTFLPKLFHLSVMYVNPHPPSPPPRASCPVPRRACPKAACVAFGHVGPTVQQLCFLWAYHSSAACAPHGRIFTELCADTSFPQQPMLTSGSPAAYAATDMSVLQQPILLLTCLFNSNHCFLWMYLCLFYRRLCSLFVSPIAT